MTSYGPGRWTGRRGVALAAVVLAVSAGAATIGLLVDRRLDRLWDARVVLTGLGLLAAGTLVAPQAHWTLRMIGRRWMSRDEPVPPDTWIRFSRFSGAVILAVSLAAQGVLTGIAAPPSVRFALDVHDEARHQERSGPVDAAEIRSIVAARNGVVEDGADGLTIYRSAADRRVPADAAAACLRLRPDGDARITPGACSG